MQPVHPAGNSGTQFGDADTIPIEQSVTPVKLEQPLAVKPDQQQQPLHLQAVTVEADAQPLPTAQSGWPGALIIIGLTLALIMGIYWATAVSMVTIWWRSETFAHGFLIIPIVTFMIWRERRRLQRLAVRPSGFGLIAVAAMAVFWLAAYLADVAVMQQLALVMMIPAVIYAVLGQALVWAMAFPLAYLFFAVPMGEGLIPPLQHFTALFTVDALQLSGLPVLLEGFHLTIPSKHNPMGWDRFLVAEACSGSRYLIASVALGCLYAYLSYRSIWRRLAFIALSIVLPIIANGIRAYGIVMIAHHSGMKYAIGVDHLIYGWIFFGVVMALMFWVGSWWREPQPSEQRPTDQPSQSSAPGQAARSVHGTIQQSWPAVAFMAVISVFVAAMGPASAYWLDRQVSTSTPVVLQAPAATSPWEWTATAKLSGWEPVFIGADAIVQQTYQTEDQAVQLFIAFYRHEGQGAELINSQNRLFDDSRWQYIDSSTAQQSGQARRSIAIRSGRGDQRLIWHWYWIAGQETISSLQAKLLRAWMRLSGQNRGSALIAIATDYELQQAQAQQVLSQYLQTMQPAIEAALEQARQR